ncbi:hypothetical protein PIB30_083304 [Stylosanthes scabra]|uniref:Uncharacterized protein n=1 Tax=Stylosanthes scabra TaxID=79078 RepID=A0ABU6XUJ4_9FABA|nr:hypothetical protein [Stylosanthes scabra]
MIGAGKNGPPGKYERWLSGASTGPVDIRVKHGELVPYWEPHEFVVLTPLLSKSFRCRTLMAAPGRGRGRGRGPQSPVMGDLGDGRQDFLAAMTNMANTIQEGIAAANAAHAAAAAAAGGGGGPAEDRSMTLASFLKINPPTFQGTANPTDADDWISNKCQRGSMWPLLRTYWLEKPSIGGKVRSGCCSKETLTLWQPGRCLKKLFTGSISPSRLGTEGDGVDASEAGGYECG